MSVNAAKQFRITYSDGDILGGGKEPVDHDSHKRRVQAILNGERSKLGICHGLRHNDSSNGDT
jgi:hypothetical protein